MLLPAHVATKLPAMGPTLRRAFKGTGKASALTTLFGPVDHTKTNVIGDGISAEHGRVHATRTGAVVVGVFFVTIWRWVIGILVSR